MTGPERATAAALTGLAGFQAALASGAPWGVASYGGQHRGVLPDPLRAVSGVAAIGYAGTAGFVLAGSGSTRVRVRTFTTVATFMSVGALVNAASRSRPERLLWTPFCAATAALAWRARADALGGWAA